MAIESCIREIREELPLIDDLITSHGELLAALKKRAPGQIEQSAVATVLHSFYNGIEKIFVRIAKRIDDHVPVSDLWHQELLMQMTKKTKKRPAVISKELAEKLSPYLGFRHFFRHAYVFQFKWDKMKELVHDIGKTHAQFNSEIEQFLAAIEK